MVEPIFKKDDYIINRNSNDMGIVKGITKKGYYQFKEFIGGMFGELKGNNYELQVNYQKFYDLCDEKEKKKLDDLIKKKKADE